MSLFRIMFIYFFNEEVYQKKWNTDRFFDINSLLKIKPTTTTAAGYIVSSFTTAATKHEYHTERVSRDWLINQRPIHEHLIALSVECVAITAKLSRTYFFLRMSTWSLRNFHLQHNKMSFKKSWPFIKMSICVFGLVESSW